MAPCDRDASGEGEFVEGLTDEGFVDPRGVVGHPLQQAGGDYETEWPVLLLRLG